MFFCHFLQIFDSLLASHEEEALLKMGLVCIDPKQQGKQKIVELLSLKCTHTRFYGSAADCKLTLLHSQSSVVQSVKRLTQQPEVPGSILCPHTFFSPSADSRQAVVSYWQKFVNEVLVNC